MLPADVLATLHPSLAARARELAFGPDEAEELLGETYVRLCQADAEGRLRDRSAQGIKRWVRSALLNVRTERGRRALRLPDALELQMAGIL